MFPKPTGSGLQEEVQPISQVPNDRCRTATMWPKPSGRQSLVRHSPTLPLGSSPAVCFRKPAGADATKGKLQTYDYLAFWAPVDIDPLPAQSVGHPARTSRLWEPRADPADHIVVLGFHPDDHFEMGRDWSHTGPAPGRPPMVGFA